MVNMQKLLNYKRKDIMIKIVNCFKNYYIISSFYNILMTLGIFGLNFLSALSLKEQ